MGKSGIGKMKVFSLDAEVTEYFLQTGNLQADEYEECDNFDRAIYHSITQEEYEALLENLQYYIDVGNQFEHLYAGDKSQLTKKAMLFWI